MKKIYLVIILAVWYAIISAGLRTLNPFQWPNNMIFYFAGMFAFGIYCHWSITNEGDNGTESTY